MSQPQGVGAGLDDVCRRRWSVADAVIMTVAHPKSPTQPGPGAFSRVRAGRAGSTFARPIAGAVIAVGAAFVLRGCGRRVRSGTAAAQGDLFTEGRQPWCA